MCYWDVFLGSHYLGCVAAENEEEARKAAALKHGYAKSDITIKKIKNPPYVL